MQVSSRGIQLIKQFEGFKAKAYLDGAGVWTVGYGHTGSYVDDGTTVTVQEADAFLRADLITAEHAISRLVTAPLTQPQYDALISFVFNLGEGNFAGSTLLRFLNLKEYQQAALEFPRWRHIGGVESAGLLKRRLAEQQLFLEGTANV